MTKTRKKKKSPRLPPPERHSRNPVPTVVRDAIVARVASLPRDKLDELVMDIVDTVVDNFHDHEEKIENIVYYLNGESLLPTLQ